MSPTTPCWVYADQESQRIVEQTIRQIDRPQRQIAIEATIAEVTLNDTLIMAYNSSLRASSTRSSTRSPPLPTPGTGYRRRRRRQQHGQRRRSALLNRALPGFNFLIEARIRRASFSTRYITSPTSRCFQPSLVVLDNQPATLQVGDQVPFSTGSATVLTANNTVVEHHRLQEHRHHFARAAARQRDRQHRARHRAGDQQRGRGNRAGSLTPTISQRRVKKFDFGDQRQTVLLAADQRDENKQRQGIRCWIPYPASATHSRIRTSRGPGPN